jgi:uncharacterized protein (TIGR03437 family)
LSVPLLYVSPTQVNAQVPFAADPGQSLLVTLRTGGGPLTASAPLQVEHFAPAFFTLNGMGRDAVAARHADYRLLDDAAPAVPGKFVFCTAPPGILEPPHSMMAIHDWGPANLVVPTLTIGGLTHL